MTRMGRRSEKHGVVKGSRKGGAVERGARGGRTGVGVPIIVVVLAADIFRVTRHGRATGAAAGAILNACEGTVYLAGKVAKVR